MTNDEFIASRRELARLIEDISEEFYNSNTTCDYDTYLASRLVDEGYVKIKPSEPVMLAKIADYERVRQALCANADYLDTLTERDLHILVLRYGLDGNGKRTYEQIGREYQVTRERIRQIEMKALRKLHFSAKEVLLYRNGIIKGAANG